MNQAYAVENLAVIINPDNPTPNLSEKDLNSIYRGLANQWTYGEPIRVINRQEIDPERVMFYKQVLGAEPGEKFYVRESRDSSRRSVFRSSIRKSDDSVKRVVGRFKNAIGYIKESSVDDTVKVIYVIKPE